MIGYQKADSLKPEPIDAICDRATSRAATSRNGETVQRSLVNIERSCYTLWTAQQLMSKICYF